MKARVIVALAVITAFTTQAASEFASFGKIGNSSCAYWLSSHVTNQDMMWIIGFWSGLNYADNLRVGETTDGAVIMGEVRKFCEKEPSLSVANATAQVHGQFKTNGR